MTKDIYRLIDSIKRKIFLLIGRAILTAIDNSGKTMTVQVTGLKDETITGIERFQEYGFESYPKIGTAECVIGFINGNREHGIVLCIHDREYRPLDLESGDTRQYDYRGNKITCKSTGIEIECLNGNKIEMISGEVKVNGTNLEVLL
jgi:phage baseplate assembly protein V